MTSVTIWTGIRGSKGPSFLCLFHTWWKYLERFWILYMVQKLEHWMYFALFFGLFVSFFFVLDLLHCFLFPVLLSTACIPHVKCSFSTESYHHDVLPMYLGECGRNNIYFINSFIWTMEKELRASCLPVKCSTIWGKTELSKRLNHL